tara:strand:- start:619 stop:2757 length:2139 start_codon:yes stop_codon:yes gene_type:complete
MKIISALLLVFLSLNLYSQCEADHTILLTNFEFTPSELVISPGETVAFINIQGDHTVNGITNTVTGEPFGNPEEFFLEQTTGSSSGVCMGVLTFEELGLYNFDCSLDFNAQLGMNLTIDVDAFDLNDLFQLLQQQDSEPSAPVWQSAYAFQYFTPSFLTSEGPWTIFAPDDNAVSEILEYMNLGQFDGLGIPDFPEILKFHIAEGLWLEEDFFDGLVIPSAQGQPLNISETSQGFAVENAQITTTNFTAYNGVIHVIDQCLAPEGVPESTVMQLIEDSENHTIFENAIFAANLSEDLSAQPILNDNESQPGPYTVFAPTDLAFDILVEEMGTTIDELLTSQFISSIVRSHIVENIVPSSDIFDGLNLLNINGDVLQIEISDDAILVYGTQNVVEITTTDLFAYNGVVHVIDAVIQPFIPDLEGTCGTWTIHKIPGNFGGWGGGSLDVFVNGVLWSSETLFSDNIEVFNMAVNNGDAIDLLFRGNEGGFQVVNENEEVVYSAIGNEPSSVYGLKPCGTQQTCGYFSIQFLDETQEGWYGGSVTVNSDAGTLTTINFYDYDPFWPERTFNIPAVTGELDFIVSPPLFETTLTGYRVRDANNTIVVDQSDITSIPTSSYEIMVCEPNISSVSDLTLDIFNLDVHPNPSNGVVFIDGLDPTTAWSAKLHSLDGKQVKTFQGVGSSSLEFTEVAGGLYALTLTTEDRIIAPIRLIKE